MHYYQFNPSDFKAKTRHLTHLERAFYRELIDLYYETEKPITGDLPKLERLLLVKTDDEKQALLSVLDEFFVLKNGAYHDFEITAKIRAYKWTDKKRNAQGTQTNAQGTDKERQTEQNGTPSGTDKERQTEQNGTPSGTDKERKQRHKNKVNYLRALLSDCGVQTPANSSITALTALCDEHKICIDWDVAERQAEQNGTPSGTDKEQIGTPKNERITINQEPLTNNQDINTHTNAREKIFEKIGDLMAWQAPPIEEMQSELIRSGIARTLSQAQYDTAIGDFKAYYEQQAQLGKPLNTDAIRKSKLRQWLAREKPPAPPSKPSSSRMDELRAMAMTAPVNEFGELPSEHDLNFYQSTVNGVSYEQSGTNQQH